jgi:DNA-binding transcriptional LysR family regulator
MNLRWVVLFATVATEGSFTRAASRLNLAQPWLSAQIRKLELELGISLFIRSTSGIALTVEGEALLPHALEIAEAATKFRQKARKMGAANLRNVRIGSHLPALALPKLVELNDTFTQRIPQFAITIERGSSPELLSQLRNGQLDVAAVIAPFAADDLESLPIASHAPYLLIPRRKANETGLPVDLSGLSIAVPPVEHQPDLFGPLFARLAKLGATIQAAPETAGEAMRQYSRMQRIATLMIEGSAQDYAGDADLEAVAIDNPPVKHVLVRLSHAEPGRAALHYWTMAKSVLGDRELL